MTRILAAVVVLVLALAPAARAQATAKAPSAAAVVVHEDLQYAEGFARDGRRNALDVYLPRGVAHPPLVMFVHGGGWTAGSKDGCAALAHAFAAHGIALASINTRLHPFAEPSDMVVDCGNALRWLHTDSERLGYDRERLYLMGHSAGAHLVTWLVLDAERFAATGVPAAAVRGVFACSGVYELRPRHHALSHVFGDDPAVRADGSPFLHARADAPPCWLFHGDRDMPCLSLSARMLRDRLVDLGGVAWAPELSGKNHVDYVFEFGSAQDRLVPRIAAAIRGERAPLLRPGQMAVAPAEPLPLDRGALGAGLVRPVGAPRCTLVWLAVARAEVERAGALARTLAPHGVACVTLQAEGATRQQVVASWRSLMRLAAELGLPKPSVLGGCGLGGALACGVPLLPGDGLRGRIAIGAPLGFRSLPTAWPTVEPVDRPALLIAERSELLVLQAEHDGKSERDDALELCRIVLGKRAGVHPVELSGTTTNQALQGLGGDGDLLVPLLRAFLLP